MDFKKFRLKHHLVDDKAGIALCYVAKNACSTLKFNFLKKKLSSVGEKVSDKDLNEGVHRYASRYSCRTESEIVNFNGVVNFVVREPVRRLVSAYLDKFVRMPELSNFSKKLLEIAGYENDYSNVSFLDFCECLTRVPPELLNEHWMPQVLHIYDDVSYRFIAMDNLKSDPALTEQLGDLSSNVREHTLKYVKFDSDYSKVSRSELKEQLAHSGSVPAPECFINEAITELLEPFVSGDTYLYEKAKRSSFKGTGYLLKKEFSDSIDNHVSMIIPVYNVEKYLVDCLDSIVEQTDKTFEVVLVNDGSTDGSLAIANEYQAKLGSRLKIISQKNKGLGGARNTGIKNAKYEFITFVDSDDVLSPLYVSSLRKLQNEKKADVVSTKLRHCDEFLEKFWTRPDPLIPDSLKELSDYQKVLGSYELNVSCGRLIRKRLVTDNELYFIEGVPHEDLYFTYKLLNLAVTHYRDQSYQYFWRQRKGSLGKSISISHIEMLSRVAFDTAAFLSERDSDSTDWLVHSRRLLTHLNNLSRKVKSESDEIKKAFRRTLVAIQGHISFAQHLLKLHISDEQRLINQSEKVFKEYTGNKPPKTIDFAFFPLRAYHVKDLMPVLKMLEEEGFSSVIVETDRFRNGNNEVSRYCNDNEIETVPIEELQAVSPIVLNSVMWNDWDPLMRILSKAFAECGVNTTAWVEGIQDYDEVDRTNRRYPYKRSKFIITPGEFDKKYFQATEQVVLPGEVVRVRDLWKRYDIDTKTTKRALINCNFSYGVLIEHRDQWLKSAVNSCLEAGYEPVISKHPFDESKVCSEYVTEESFYDALETCDVSIQRFASGILESLAMKKPVIYFNPHKEKVDKFSNPLGAYEYAESVKELEKVLYNRSFFFNNGLARKFLSYHAGDVDSLEIPGSKVFKQLGVVRKSLRLPLAFNDISTANFDLMSKRIVANRAKEIEPIFEQGNDSSTNTTSSLSTKGVTLSAALLESNTLFNFGEMTASNQILKLLAVSRSEIYDIFWEQRQSLINKKSNEKC